MRKLVIILTIFAVVAFGLPALSSLHAEETPPEEVPQEEVIEEESIEGEVVKETEEATEGIEEEEETDGEGGDVLVETGDASSEANSKNAVNANNVNSESEETTVDADNDAEIETTTESVSETGGNSASGSGGSGVVNTGNAYATANSVNIINTNIIDSFGLLVFQDLFAALGFDFRTLDLSYFFGPGASGCCGSSLTLNADNNANVSSDTGAYAGTGGNSAEGKGDGSAIVRTGDAYASANSVNVVNSNFIQSNYLLVSINNFGDLFGDIVLPGADFFEQLLAVSKGASGPLTANMTNNATVTTDTEAVADSGGNTVETEGGDAVIETGDAIAGSTSYNQVNTTEIGGTSIFLLFRIWGNWSGTVHGLPEGISWKETPYGIQLVNDVGGSVALDNLGEDKECCNDGSLDVDVENDANVHSSVKAWALTGDNMVKSQDGVAVINTGNAYASANSVNIINTNLIGRNWIFAIFNIFGDWNGNISFGHPDLWLGATAESGNPTIPGSEVTYHFTVSNRGDSDATNVRLSAEYLKDMLAFAEGVDLPAGIEWVLGNIKKGETKEFSFKAIAGLVDRGQAVSVPMTATVTSDEDDNNKSDNTEQITIVVANPLPRSGAGANTYEAMFGGRTFPPKLSVTKTTSVNEAESPAVVDYTITIKNEGGNAYNVSVVDNFYGPSNLALETQEWYLGTVLEKEEVKITYSIAFDENTISGEYKNVAEVFGKGGFEGSKGNTLPPLKVTNVLHVIGEAPVCGEYLTAYIKPGANNNVDAVKKLQFFLASFEGESDIAETGTYDTKTIAAVHRFQNKYRNDILLPWGARSTTGYVYHTTKKKVNELYCKETTAFPLSGEQLGEIDLYKNSLQTRIQNAEETDTELIELPEDQEIGALPSEGEVLAVEQVPEPVKATAPKRNNVFGILENSAVWMHSMMASALSPFINMIDR